MPGWWRRRSGERLSPGRRIRIPPNRRRQSPRCAAQASKGHNRSVGPISVSRVGREQTGGFGRSRANNGHSWSCWSHGQFRGCAPGRNGIRAMAVFPFCERGVRLAAQSMIVDLRRPKSGLSAHCEPSLRELVGHVGWEPTHTYSAARRSRAFVQRRGKPTSHANLCGGHKDRAPRPLVSAENAVKLAQI
jgi:hypothetical protein